MNYHRKQIFDQFKNYFDLRYFYLPIDIIWGHSVFHFIDLIPTAESYKGKIAVTGTLFKDLVLDDLVLRTKGYKLFAAATDELGMCIWINALSGESTCSEMFARVLYDKEQSSFSTTGFYTLY